MRLEKGHAVQMLIISPCVVLKKTVHTSCLGEPCHHRLTLKRQKWFVILERDVESIEQTPLKILFGKKIHVRVCVNPLVQLDLLKGKNHYRISNENSFSFLNHSYLVITTTL